MELGARLRQARQEAGLSQRQLCGEKITRNMLSQIENGSARPSMDTLQYFARQLGKPVSFFLEEQPVLSPNQQLMQQLRKAGSRQVLELLPGYREPDDQFDPERFLLEALACLELAQQAIGEEKLPYARSLLQQAKQAGAKTPYYTQDTERRRLLLCHRANAQPAEDLARTLPPLEEELLLRAQAAIGETDSRRAQALLQAAQEKTPFWHFLMAQALLLERAYAPAASALGRHSTPSILPKPAAIMLGIWSLPVASQERRVLTFTSPKASESGILPIPKESKTIIKMRFIVFTSQMGYDPRKW